MSSAIVLMYLLGAFVAQQAAQPIQPAVGTLVIDAELPVGTARGDYFEAGWLFIDGRLIGRLPVKRTVTLDWGSHDVRIVIGAYSNEKPRYFVVGWPRYFMNRGATETLQIGPVIEKGLNGGGTPAGVEAAALDPALAQPADLARIDEARKQMLQTPPSRPVVRIPVSASLGGPREFDADQLRFLSRFLKAHLGTLYTTQVDDNLRQLIAALQPRR